MPYRLVMTRQVRDWLHALRSGDADRIDGSRLHNLKELRPGSSGVSEVRILFIFDPVRNAVLLVAGDKAGRWKEWYAEAIPAAEAAYEAYVEGQR